eukprot:GHVQ01030034.1.p1 GENE.GHVQ01030034.1~~GHVQ01030034.1.p1  ORF type:complete len:1199 (-),score=141.27 GHVQ01030034.1:426-4022(-)
MFLFLTMFVGSYVTSFIINARMALILLSGIPLIVAASIFLAWSLSTAGKRSLAAYKMAGSIAEETITSIKTVASFGIEEAMCGRYRRHLAQAEWAVVRGALYSGIGLGGLFSSMFLMYALGFWYGGALIADSIEGTQVGDPTDPDDVLVVFFGILIGAFGLGQMAPSVTEFVKALQAASDFYEVIDRKSLVDPRDTTGHLALPTLQCDIVFKNVRFAYPTRQDQPVFTSLDLHVPAGKTVALVGGSGCGKSSIVQLLERYYDVTDGTILVDGIPLKEYNVSWWRSQIGIVSQEPKLFSLSIDQNIRAGGIDAERKFSMTPEAGPEGLPAKDAGADVKQACVKANASMFIDAFPMKYNTPAGEGGSQLSGGQKQRIAIARAMMRQPALLILDEATSALDTESERIVQSALDNLVGMQARRTTIIIAHRLSTIRNADKIIVLGKPEVILDGDTEHKTAQGAVVIEEGTHDELMQREDGAYHRLVNAQSLDGGQGPLERVPTYTSHDASKAQLADEEQENERSLVEISLRSESLKAATMISELEEPQRKCWSRKKKADTKPKPKNVPFSRLFGFIKPYWFVFALGLAASCLKGLVFPGMSIIFANMLGVLFSPDPDYIRTETGFWALMFVALSVACFVAAGAQAFCMEYPGQKMVTVLRDAIFSNLVYQEIGFFDAPTSSAGNLTAVLSKDVTMVKGLIGNNTGAGVQAIAAVVAGLVIAFVSSAELAGVMLVIFLMLMPCAYIQTKFMHEPPKDGLEDDNRDGDDNRRLQTLSNSPEKIFSETVSSMRTVAAFGLEQTFEKLYSEVLEESYKKTARNAIVFGIFWGISQGFQYFANALALWYGGYMVENKGLSTTDMLMTVFALLFAAHGSGEAFMFATDATKAQIAARKVIDIIDRNSQIDSRSGDGKTMDDMKGEVMIDQVMFRYPQRPTVSVYDSVSFTIGEGNTVALVGSSGCGKSTVVSLLERFYDIEGSENRNSTAIAVDGVEELNKPPVGRITIDGVDIRDMNLRFLRSQLALVSQEPVLFNTTIEDNVRYGKHDASQTDVENACKLANAHTFIQAFPEGYQTAVGKLGSQLSGGQKQRIALARAIIRNPKILILDEATSALDSESEKVVQDALEKLLASKSRTTLVIAHRLKTIANSDNIVVLDATPHRGKDGKTLAEGSRVVEQGTHQELVEISGGLYQHLVKLSKAGALA